MIFKDWAELRHIFYIGIASYLVLIFFLRISGKRTLSKLNAFDLVVTVALGSTLASSFTQRSLSFAGTTLTFALLVGLQFIITWISVRSNKFDRFIKSEPSILYYKGRFFDHILKQERVTREEVQSALRTQGIAQMEDAVAVVLESNAELVCLRKWMSDKPDMKARSDSTLPRSSGQNSDDLGKVS